MPFLAPLASIAASAGPLISLGGGIAQAFGNKSQYDAVSSTQRYNQSVYDQNAALAATAAANNKAAAERKKRAKLSTLQAHFGYRGVDLSGSPLLVMAESAADLELDIQNEEFNSLVDVHKARSQGVIAGQEADAYKSAGKSSMMNSILKATSEFASEY